MSLTWVLVYSPPLPTIGERTKHAGERTLKLSTLPTETLLTISNFLPMSSAVSLCSQRFLAATRRSGQSRSGTTYVDRFPLAESLVTGYELKTWILTRRF